MRYTYLDNECPFGPHGDVAFVVDDSQAPHHRRRLVLLHNVNDQLGLGDVTNRVSGTDSQVQLVLINIQGLVIDETVFNSSFTSKGCLDNRA